MKSFTKRLLSLAALSGSLVALHAGNIDLNTWSQAGPSSSGNWTVSPDGSTVSQSRNGSPTVFLSPDTLINDNVRGDIEVRTTSDDDFIGFVFGWQSTNDFYLFSWKQGNQSPALNGLVLAHVTAGISNIPWDHQNNHTGYQVLDTNLGTGWADNTPYEFTIGYRTNAIDVSIAGGSFGTGTSVLSANGSFAAGQYGFYNFSQSTVTYSGFEDNAPPPVGVADSASTSLLLLLGLAALGRFRRS